MALVVTSARLDMPTNTETWDRPDPPEKLKSKGVNQVPVNYFVPRNKYNNRKIIMGDQTFDSQREFDRWCELVMLQKMGVIQDLRRQVKFELIPCQRSPDGQLLEKAVNYYADFVYTSTDNGRTVVEDSKGTRTKEYIIKRKLMLQKYDIQIMEV